jgi:uncharacterized protein involved in exopolysaccharide biosynthesis
LLALSRATAPLDDLTRQQRTAEENFLMYTKKSEEARIAESLDQQKISNVAVVQAPTEPYFPTRPKVRMNLALGFALAGLLAVGVPLLVEHLRGAIHGKAQLAELTGLPVFTAYKQR